MTRTEKDLKERAVRERLRNILGISKREANQPISKPLAKFSQVIRDLKGQRTK
jgi:hypothetical protein